MPLKRASKSIQMDKNERQRLAYQIARLCEKQYRKGFQQGFHTCLNKQMTKKEVDEFRFKGMDADYREVRWPHNSHRQNAFDRLLAESAMPNMNELIRLLREFE